MAGTSELSYVKHVVSEYYDYFAIPVEKNGVKQYEPFQDRIAVEEAHFSYEGSEREALCGLNLEIRKGKHVVIVGENGSGKTTLSKLLTGAYLPSAGKVTYDGHATEEFDRKSLYAHISMVQQDFVRYRFTLRENIGIANLARMGDDKAMEELLGRTAGEELIRRAGGLDAQLGRECGCHEELLQAGGEYAHIWQEQAKWYQEAVFKH